MKKYFILVFAALLWLHQDVKAQCNSVAASSDPCSAPLLCNTAQLDTFCGRLGAPGRNLIPNGLCTGSPFTIENNQWIRFVAQTASLSLRLTISDCNAAGGTIQAQMFKTTDCNNAAAYTSVSNCINNPSTITTDVMNATGLVPGDTVYLMFDGGGGAICSYDIDVVSGTLQNTVNTAAPSAVRGFSEVCPNAQGIQYSVPFNSNAIRYSWQITYSDGTPTINAITTDSFYLVSFPATGTASVCCRYISNCDISLYTCKTVTITSNITGIDTTINFCSNSPDIIYGDIAQPSGVLSFGYGSGMPLTETVPYTWTNASGCDSTMNIVINRFPRASSSLALFARSTSGDTIICGQPYNVTSGQAIRNEVSVCSGGSSNGCDSTVNLTIYNADITLRVTPVSPQINCVTPRTVLKAEPVGVHPTTFHNFSYRWFNTNDTNTPLSTDDTLVTFTAGTYRVIVKDSVLRWTMPRNSYRIFYDTVTINVPLGGTAPPAPQIALVPTELCVGTEGIFRFGAVNEATSYVWTLPNNWVALSRSDSNSIRVATTGGRYGNVQLSIASRNACGTSAPTTITVRMDSFPRSLDTISAAATACQNGTITYTVPAGVFMTNYVWGVPNTATLISGQGTTSIRVNWGNSLGGLITVYGQYVCGNTIFSEKEIVIDTFVGLNAGRDTALCGRAYTLRGRSSRGFGFWRVNSPAGGTAIFTDANSPTSAVNATLEGRYEFIWTETNPISGCTKSDTVYVRFNDIPSVSMVRDSCNAANNAYTVKFQINGGTTPYNVYLSGTNTLAGTVDLTGLFTANEIPVGNYSFEVRDAALCSANLVTGSQACLVPCTTEAGDLEVTPIFVCANDTARVNYLGGFVRDAANNDTLQFVLHTGNAQTGILMRSATPEFVFRAPLRLDSVYYISAIAGNDSSGNVTLTDRCFSSSASTPIVFRSLPTATIGNDTTICAGNCVDLRFNMRSVPNFNITINDGTRDTTLIGINNSNVYTVCPSATSVYRIVAIQDDNGCRDTTLTSQTRVTVRATVFAGRDTVPLNVCSGIDSTILLGNFIHAENNGGRWSEYSTPPSVGGAFSSAAGRFRTRNQASGIYRFRYVMTGTSPCPNDTSEVTVNILPTPIADAGVDDTLDCTNIASGIVIGGANTTIGPGIGYAWIGVNSNSAFPTVNNTGTYKLLVTSQFCSAEDSMIVRVDTAAPSATLRTNVTRLTCAQDTAILDATISTPIGVLAYEWRLGTHAFDDNAITNVVQAGEYILEVTNLLNGCTDTTSVQIVSDQVRPTVSILNPDILNCRNDTIRLDASASSVGNRYVTSWSTATGHIRGRTDTILISVDSAGRYNLVIRDTVNFCVDSTSVLVRRDVARPIAKAVSLDTLNCLNQVVSLSGRGSTVGVGIGYLWTTNTGHITSGERTLVPLVDEAGLYYLTVLNNINGCSTVDSTLVVRNSQRPRGVRVAIAKPRCYGGCDGSIRVDSVLGGTSPYLFSVDGKVYTTAINLKNICAGNYRFFIQDAGGCNYDTSFAVLQDPQLALSIGVDTLIKLGDSVRLVAQVADTARIRRVIWQPLTDSSIRNNTRSFTQLVRPLQQTNYKVTIIDSLGCSVTQHMTISLDKNRPVFIPSAFTPNADGVNDIFMVHAAPVVKQIRKMQIFDRWGEKIFERLNFQPNDPLQGWDGKIGTKLALPNVYIYWLEMEYLDGLIEVIEGDFTLLK